MLHDRKLFDLVREVETTAARVLEEVKPGRNLRTNVELYTALVLQSLGLQLPMFVAMFACGRVVGWCAHVDRTAHGGPLDPPAVVRGHLRSTRTKSTMRLMLMSRS